MKISKNLLSAIAIGITLSAAPSCTESELVNVQADLDTFIAEGHSDSCTDECEVDHNAEGSGDDPRGPYLEDCPACGMG